MIHGLRGAAETQELNGEGRFEFEFPLKAPFHDQKLSNSTLLLPLISSWLEAEHFGIELDEACMLSVGPGTAPQQAHSDVPEMIYLGDEFFGLQVGDRALRARPKSWQNMLKGRSTFNLNGTYSTVGPHDHIQFAAVDAAAAAESDGAVIYAYLRD